MDKLTLCLWFDGDAEDAARFYVGLLPNSRIDSLDRAPADYPAGEEGAVIMANFTLAGRSFQGLNGGAGHPFTDAISLSISTRDQAETDRLWDALIADGGMPVQCGWLKDRFGLSWQIVPEVLPRMLNSPDRAAAKRAMEAMMAMVKIDVATLERAFGSEAA